MEPNGFRSEPLVDFPGWHSWELNDPTSFNGHVMGRLIVRKELAPAGHEVVRLRMFPVHQHSNIQNNVHGGTTLALIDISLFSGLKLLLGGDAAAAVTLDLSTQFIGAGQIGQPLDSVVEVLRETRRLVFVRGLVEQGENTVAAFAGTIRKSSVT